MAAKENKWKGMLIGCLYGKHIKGCMEVCIKPTV